MFHFLARVSCFVHELLESTLSLSLSHTHNLFIVNKNYCFKHNLLFLFSLDHKSLTIKSSFTRRTKNIGSERASINKTLTISVKMSIKSTIDANHMQFFIFHFMTMTFDSNFTDEWFIQINFDINLRKSSTFDI